MHAIGTSVVLSLTGGPSRSSHRKCSSAPQTEYLAGFVRRRGLVTEFVDDSDDMLLLSTLLFYFLGVFL